MHPNPTAALLALVLHALLMSASTFAQTASDKRCSSSNPQQFKPMYDPMPGKMPYMPMYYPMPGKDAYPGMFTPMYDSKTGKNGYPEMFDPTFNSMPKEKVSVHVFYTTFCMDSQNLIMNQIAPGWPKYESKADIEFIPWGKSMSTMDGGFRCQHGPEECRQNMIDSCVLSNLGKGAKQLQYVACRMQMPAFDDHVQKCAEMQQVSWSDVVSCTTSGMGKDLQLEAERVTRQMTPGPRFVPTVVFNKVYNDLYQMEVERGGFDKVMCMNFQAC